ncbi:M14 family metallocarboxypeptidase [Cocleimonas flava]|uniref:Peptidase M14 domain-containing protein n=1 Tax=Cocleimonas flava TaxID=634765 RepID=A0A4R1ESV7_9GAMM|nr:M14 family metallocarboxypeptidase [Cocleimonas flava]TCJ84686.1 hypothetical protein EV695_2646 [Cocleimonas flava]
MSHNSEPSKKWGTLEKQQWLSEQKIQRSYQDSVVAKIQQLNNDFDIHQYGTLEYQIGNYPLFAVHSKSRDKNKPNIMITGGVHGYETSGVQGAIRFLEKKALDYTEYFNFVVAPCISPWGYETINRWNPETDDPNRSFSLPSPAQEAANIMAYVESLDITFLAHLDLHETTDTDNSVFRPALAARDAITMDNWDIPDGFYLVGDTENPVPEFQKAIIQSVEKVTHIAPGDEKGEMIGDKVEQHGVINYQTRKLGLCAGFSGTQYSSTTEVYPDSPKVDDENCIQAQVAAVVGALDFLIKTDTV